MNDTIRINESRMRKRLIFLCFMMKKIYNKMALSMVLKQHSDCRNLLRCLKTEW